jgi:isopentenyl phosphate kinase
MDELILVKLGGSVITNKNVPFSEDLTTIKRLAKEIHGVRQEKKFRLVVGHGGGSYPHIPASEFKTNDGIIDSKSYEGIAKVQDAASRLNRIIVRELLNVGENAMSIQLSSCSISENGQMKEMFLEPIKKLLDFNMVPVPYGDVGLDRRKGCYIISTERVFDYLARNLSKMDEKYRISKIIMCARVRGVFTDNPDVNSYAELIKEITPKNIKEVESSLKGSFGIDVTGGMLHKVKMLLELAKLGVESEVINAKEPDLLKRALLGERGLGTIIKKD